MSAAPPSPTAPGSPQGLGPAERAACVALLAERVSELLAQPQADEAVAADARRFCSPATLERFARAVCFDVAKAEEFVRKTLRWRAERRPWAALCPGCEASPRAHSMRCVGCDASGRPVLYHSFSQAEGRHVTQHNVSHLVRCLEDCCSYMDGQSPPVEQWVWVLDFHGYGLWDNNPSTVVAAASFLPMHPNRLFKVVLLDAPAAFSASFIVVSSFLSDITKAKISFVQLPKLVHEVTPWAGHELASWLYAEASDNRRLEALGPTAQAAKCYWLPPVSAGEIAAGVKPVDEAPAESESLGVGALRLDSTVESESNGEAAHDPRGTASWVASPGFFTPVNWSEAGKAAAEARARAVAAGAVAGGKGGSWWRSGGTA
jgi:hypothetical protein